jgi:Ser/Thr protein kinase RdoA (MazF antagonist)
MYGNIDHRDEYLQKVAYFIQNEYNINVSRITPAKRGFFGETWKMETDSNAYFVKLDYTNEHKKRYRCSFQVVEHLNNHGIDCISKIIKTANGNLSTNFNGSVLGIFEWIDGENIETDETKTPEYHMLAKVYTVPHVGLAVPTEDFLGGSADKFFNQWQKLNNSQLHVLFEENRSKLEHRAVRLKHFADLCRKDMSGFCITHGDAGGNMIKTDSGYCIVDWDDAIIAPPERDAWNMLCYEGKSEWARSLFQSALKKHGNSHILRNEYLAYYCYYYYFFYLTEYLDAFMQLGGIHKAIGEYFVGWIENRASYADRFY